MKKIFFFFTLCLFLSACQQDQAPKVSNETAKPEFVVQKTTPTFQTNLPPGYPLGPFPIASDYPYNIDLKSMDGKILNSSEVLKQNGKPSVVMFWLTTCYPCGMELKAIQEKFPQWQKEADFNLYAISTDFSKNAEKIGKRVEAGGWDFEVYHDFNRQFMGVMPGGLNGLPQVFVFDKKGDIVYHKRKYSPGDEDTLFAKVKELAK